MKKIGMGLKLSGIALGALCFGSISQAATVSFASFDPKISGNNYKFTNSGASSSFGLNGLSVLPVNFQYKVSNGTGLVNTVIDADLTISADVNGTAAQAFGTDFQSMKNVSMQFKAVSPIMGLSNLLTITTASTGLLSGRDGGATVNFNGDTSAGDTVVFTSDFLDFSQTINRNFALSFVAANPSLSINGNGYLNTFTIAGNGTFASDPQPNSTVPEPGSIAMLVGSGVTGSLAVVRRRRRS